MAFFPFFSKDVFRLWIYKLGNPWISAYIIRQAAGIVNRNRFEIDTKILDGAFSFPALQSIHPHDKLSQKAGEANA